MADQIPQRRRLGLTLPNRGVMFGATSVEELLQLAELAEAEGFDSLWVGDGLICKPRVDSIVFLAMLAARTTRPRLGVGCYASFLTRHPLQLGVQWASLDVASNGRMDLAACLGGVGPGAAEENEAFGLVTGSRVSRFLESVEVLKRLWTETQVTHEGTYFKFRNITLEPRPVQQPRPPILIANNPQGKVAESPTVQRAMRRVGKYADGWMTNGPTPEEFAARLAIIHESMVENGRAPNTLDTTLYFNVNLNPDREEAIAETQRFLKVYYESDWPRDRVERWTALGTPTEAVDHLERYFEAGVHQITLRVTSWNQRAQVEQFINEVLPAIRGKVSVS